ncbi:MAG: radical SAM protein, partial [Thermoproteota archaeon]
MKLKSFNWKYWAAKTIQVLVNLAKRQMLVPMPIQSFNFEVTRRCNGRCTYCNIWRTPSRVEDELKPDEVRELLKPRKLFASVSTIGVTGGEPFLRRDLVELCQALKEVCPNARIGLVTNGLLPGLVENTVRRILTEVCSDVSCGVSIDGFPAADGYTRGDVNHYRLAWETARRLRRLGVAMGIGSTLVDANIDEALEFKRFVQSLGYDYAFEIASTSPHYYKNEELETLKRKHLSTIERLAREGKTTFQYYQPTYFET